MQGVLAFAKHWSSFEGKKVIFNKKVKFFSYTSCPTSLPHLHWSFTSEGCEKYCFPHSVAGCTMHLYHLLTLDQSISLFSFYCYHCLFYFSFLSVQCSGSWFQKETMLLQVLSPQEQTRSDNYTPPPAQRILHSPSALSLGWTHHLTLSSASDAL